LKNTEELRRLRNSATSSFLQPVLGVGLEPRALGFPVGEAGVGILAQDLLVAHAVKGRPLAWAQDLGQFAQQVDGAGAARFERLDGLALLEQFLALPPNLVVVAELRLQLRHVGLQDGVVALGLLELGGGLQVEEDDEPDGRQNGETHEQELALAGLLPLRPTRGE
jgi:hypothetical protein